MNRTAQTNLVSIEGEELIPLTRDIVTKNSIDLIASDGLSAEPVIQDSGLGSVVAAKIEECTSKVGEMVEVLVETAQEAAQIAVKFTQNLTNLDAPRVSSV